MPLSPEQIQQLLNLPTRRGPRGSKTPQAKTGITGTSSASAYPEPEQHGPLRFVDTQNICLNRGCRSPTWLKVHGVPRCAQHALIELNAEIWRLTQGTKPAIVEIESPPAPTIPTQPELSTGYPQNTQLETKPVELSDLL